MASVSMGPTVDERGLLPVSDRFAPGRAARQSLPEWLSNRSPINCTL